MHTKQETLKTIKNVYILKSYLVMGNEVIFNIHTHNNIEKCKLSCDENLICSLTNLTQKRTSTYDFREIDDGEWEDCVDEIKNSPAQKQSEFSNAWVELVTLFNMNKSIKKTQKRHYVVKIVNDLTNDVSWSEHFDDYNSALTFAENYKKDNGNNSITEIVCEYF